MRQVFLNGQFVPESEAKISVFDRSIQFADSVYEVLSILDGRIVDFDGHIGRLERSLDELSMKGGPSRSEWLEIFRRLVEKNNVNEGTLYLQVTRGEADRNFYYPPPNTELTLIAFTQSRNLIDHPVLVKGAKGGMNVISLPDKRWERCDIKTVQLLYASMMKMQAKAVGADDAWLVRDGIVTEGTSNNAVIITQDNILITHKVSPAILSGTTRNIILELAHASPLKIEERGFTLEEAYAAKEAFISAASLFVMPVLKVDNMVIGDGAAGEYTMALRKKYIDWAKNSSL